MRRRGRHIGLGLSVVCLLACVSSCRESARRSLLTFFFEGVPPQSEEGPETPARPAPTEGGLFASEENNDVTWYVHEPVRECKRCHGDQPQRQFSREVGLVAEVPQLCYQCHQGASSNRRWVHAPVVGGDCLWCHRPHRSRYEHLLLEAPPDLCFQCHDLRAVEEIDYHALPTYRQCTACHAGHSSDTKHLLISASTDGDVPFGHEDYRRVLNRAHADAEQGADFPSMMTTVRRHLEQQELGSARAYLMGIRGSGKVGAAQNQRWEAMVHELAAAESAATEQQAIVGQDRILRMAQRYYESVEQFHQGELEAARVGFEEVMNSGLIPPPIEKTIEQYLRRIDEADKSSAVEEGGAQR